MTLTHSCCLSVFLKENLERETKEAARRRRLQELEEQKRHSWAGGEEAGGHTYNQTLTLTLTQKHIQTA